MKGRRRWYYGVIIACIFVCAIAVFGVHTLLRTPSLKSELYLPCNVKQSPYEIQLHMDAAVRSRETNCHGGIHDDDIPSVLTYYEPREEEVDYSRDVLHLWSTMWQYHGWRVVILNETYARTHRMHGEFREAMAQLPTVNSKAYEMNCYMRWLAYEKWTECVGAPVLIVDYDVLNQGLLPEEWIRRRRGMRQADPICHLHYPSVPALVTVNHLGLVRVRTMFMWQATHCQVYPMSWRGFYPRIHTSDMLLVNDHPELCPFMDLGIASSFGEPHWESSLVCHFSHHNTYVHGYAMQWDAMIRHTSSHSFTFIA